MAEYKKVGAKKEINKGDIFLAALIAAGVLIGDIVLKRLQLPL